MTKEELIMNIQQEWRCDDKRSAEQKRIETGKLIDDWVASKNLVKPDVSGRSELLFAFIAEVKKEFADQNWDYLDFIAERVLKANNSH